MAKKLYDAVAIVGTYTDRQGAEKKRYLNVGSVFENDKGHLSMKIDAMPVGEFNGWISFYEPKAKDGQAPTANESAARAQSAPAGSFEDMLDDLPF